MSRATAALGYLVAGGVVGSVLGAAAAGLAIELLRRGVLWLVPWGEQ